MPPTDANQNRYQGMGDGFSRAFELGLTPALFGGFGFLLDRWFGFTPVLTICMTILGVVGVFLRLWYGYDAEMRAHEAAMVSRFSSKTSTAVKSPAVKTDAS